MIFLAIDDVANAQDWQSAAAEAQPSDLIDRSLNRERDEDLARLERAHLQMQRVDE